MNYQRLRLQLKVYAVAIACVALALFFLWRDNDPLLGSTPIKSTSFHVSEDGHYGGFPARFLVLVVSSRSSYSTDTWPCDCLMFAYFYVGCKLS